MKKFLKKAEGFTLVELIVVIAILGILAGVAVPAYTGYINKANDAAVVTELDALATAAQAAASIEGTAVVQITVAADGTITVNPDTVTAADVEAFYDDANLAAKIAKHSTYKTTGAKWTPAAGWVANG